MISGRIKIARHMRWVCPMTKSSFKIQPASVGPTAGASPTTRPFNPMAVPSCSLGKTLVITTCISGMVIPTAQAWMIRPNKKIVQLDVGANVVIKSPIIRSE